MTADTIYPPKIVVRAATFADIGAALSAGWGDFLATARFGLFFGAFFAFGGIGILAMAWALDLSYLAYPTAVGFSLIGPFAAVGLYEVSRRHGAAQHLVWRDILGVIFAQRRRELGWMAFVTMFMLIMWMYQVRVLLAIFLGFQSFTSFEGFLQVIFTTFDGLMFLGLGHIFGSVLALILYSATVISFPLLLEQEHDFITAMITSFKAVTMSPVVMIGWAAVIGFTLYISMIPAFLGLIVTLPVLGHATWHLYKRLISFEA
ncbi:DUF2189 domain-containing protein [Nisaea acidiphila]|uniref:DUF2189 domain-containing protein n=1 Tax=Nisaea acidiphila TaxID=1862145 RepID=A0A9J7ASK4_9PROT|nr:DUF2189 domain-containing protein [Nisaea acidiphila]UUX50643.1 DUF2189 domain-containing protein [Nisaea acidiphila]